MKLLTIVLAISYISCIGTDSTPASDSEEGEDNSRLYMDALVAAMEVLFALKGNIRYISLEFDKINTKLGINITEDKRILTESDNILERDIQEVQNKFQADLMTVAKVPNPLKTETVDTILNNLETLKQRADAMENQFCRQMVEAINDQVDQGKTDLYKFQDDIEEIMRKMDEWVATAPVTTRRLARVYRTTERSFY